MNQIRKLESEKSFKHKSITVQRKLNNIDQNNGYCKT